MPSIRKVSSNSGNGTSSGTKRTGVRSLHSSTSTSVLDRIGNWQDLRHDTGLKINAYGRSGTGKSTLASTAPKPILYIVCSGGSRPGEMRSVDTPENREVIHPVVLDNSSEMRDLVAYQESTNKYATIVLDHGSGFQDLVLREVTNISQIPAQLSWGIATQQQWGQVSLQCKEYLRSLLSLSCHAIIIAQERDFKPEGSDDLILPNVCAAMTPSLTGWLNTAVDYIVNTYIREKYIEKRQPSKTKGQPDMVTRTRVKGAVEYCLRVGPHSVYTTKFRVPRVINNTLPECIVDPSFDKILALAKGVYTK